MRVEKRVVLVSPLKFSGSICDQLAEAARQVKTHIFPLRQTSSSSATGKEGA